uniref:ShKT domain-containing protein n=1 Tax=Panagrolaimus sp. ES5 TaxID=591445 RepID=A0AC34G5I3_9BILA
LANGILQNDTKLMKMLENIEIVVFPVLNPDGYEYTRSDPRNALVRMWRKSRSHERCATNRNGEKSCCRGTDLNRNFAYKFAETGTSYHPCSEIYHGAGPFSEPESRNVRDAIINSDLTGRIDAYVTLHAYSQLFIYPFSNRKRHYPQDVAELKKVAQKAVSAISRLFGTHYLIGTGPEIIYAYAGGSSDWAKETAKIKYSYTIELRPSYYSWNGFVLNKALLVPTARETFDGIMVVLDTVASEAREKSSQIIQPSNIPSQQQFIPAQTRQTTLAPSTTRMPMLIHRQPQPQHQHFQQQKSQHLSSHSASSSSCRDSVEDCNRWLSQSPLLCSTSRLSMKRQCPKTCNLC